MSTLTKYRVISAITFDHFAEELNKNAAEGYGLAFFSERPEHLSAVMKLKDEQVKLEEAEDLINVDIGGQPGGELQKKLAEGWVIIAAFSKVVTIMKPKKASP